MNVRTLCITTALGLALGLGSAAAQDDSTKYQQWPGADAAGDIDDLVQDLEKLIDQAERDQAADPQFLDDLRNALADYQNPWTTRLLYDDFRDGNYTASPTWTVSSGAFKVDKAGGNIGLKSSINVPGQTSSTGSPALDIIGSLLGSQGTQQAAQPPFSAIYTPVKISNAFATRIEFTSRDRAGRIDFGPYQGPSGAVAYRVAYLPGQTKDSLKLIRITANKPAVAIATYKGALNLEDNRRHVLEWTRDRNGAMTVVLDGQELITATDRTITKPFDGFLMINTGGTYWVRSITVDGSKV
jgi:hypothetical protein